MADKPQNVLALTYWSFGDALVQTYVLPYVRMIQRQLPPGSTIYLFTLEQSRYTAPTEELQRRENQLRESGVELIRFPYTSFGLKMAAKWLAIAAYLWWLVMTRGVTTIHAWCTPAGAIGALLSLATGRRLIIDSFEPHAESMVEVGDWAPGSRAFRILFLLEKLQARRASAVIATASGMRDYSQKTYGFMPRRFYVKPACVDLDRFALAPKDPALLDELCLQDKLVCLYAGKIGGIYLREELFALFAAAAEHWGDRLRVLLLSATPPDEVAALARQAKLPQDLIIHRYVQPADMPRYMALADFAVNPVKPVPTKRYCTSIKDGEYWAMGLPVIIPPHISDDSDIIAAAHAGAILQEFTPAAYNQALAEIDALLAEPRESLASRVRALAKDHRALDSYEHIYQELYAS